VRRGTNRAFSVIEMMIGVAMLGIFAAIAVPNFIEMQYRVRRAEIPTNLDGIKTAVLAYESAHGHLIEERMPRPDAYPGKRERAWKMGTRFDQIGWVPEGEVHGSYTVTTQGPGDFSIRGICDVDGDGAQASYTATRHVNARQTTKADVY